jgi:putative ABC transport system permease protein
MLRSITCGVRALFQKKQLARELDLELREFLKMATDEKMRAGMDRKEAVRAVRLERGSLERTKEVVRTAGWEYTAETFWQDLGFGIRSLRKNPGFVVVVVLSLALSIGANSTIFSVVNALIYRPLPYDGANRLVAIWETPTGQPDQRQSPPIAELLDWKKQNDVFEDIALTSDTENGILSSTGSPESVQVMDVTPNFFAFLGARPALGRVFYAEEMQEHTQAVVISDAFWKSHFHSGADVLGKTLHISGMISTVVGVMPPGFAPFYGERVDLWQPIDAASSRYAARQDHWLVPVARLKPGVTLAQAQTEMDVIGRRLEQIYPETNKGISSRLQPLHDALFGRAREGLYPLFGAVAFVLLIACANVANLMQSRAETRRNEFAMRASLGASGGRLTQQLLVESALLAFSGGLLGVLFSFWGIKIFRSLAGNIPGSELIDIDRNVFLFAFCISLLTAFLFGLYPAVQVSRSELNDTVRKGEQRTLSGSRGLVRHALAVSEVALAMVLLIGAGLMINSIVRVQHVDPGFDASNLLTMSIQLPEGGRYVQRVPGGDMEQATPQVSAFYQQLLARIAVLPGVESVGSITGLPSHFAEGYTFTVLGHAPPPPDQRIRVGYDEVMPGFFETLRIPLKKGRYLNEHDTASAMWAIVVNETFARQFFPNEDPIGQQVLMRYDPYPVNEDRPRVIVGIVGDVRHFGLGDSAPPFAYASHLQQGGTYPGGSIVTHLWQDIAIRTEPGHRPTNLGTSVKRIVAELDPDQPVSEAMTMEQILAKSVGVRDFYVRILGIFAGIALLLAVMGIYGVMSYYVSQRRREMGIRIALGAAPGNVLGRIVKIAVQLSLLGVALGCALALGLTRLISQFLYGVRPSDPVTYVVVAGALVAVALVASFLPARRATKVDPLTVLRYE